MRVAFRLGRLRPRQLRDLGERHRVSLHGLKKKWDLVEALASAPDASEILMELEAQAPAERDAGLILGRDSSLDFDRVEDLLVQARKRFQERRFEAANLGASIALAEDAWKRGADFLDRGRLRAARESFLEAAQRADDARAHRIREVEDSVGSVSDHIELARNVGAEMREAEELHAEARTAIAAGEHGQAGDLLKRAERLAMKGPQKHIERAIQLREAQVEKARAILIACEPVLKEAESYDLNPAEVRTLLRQAQDVLTKGDYLGGLTFARNAEEATRRLEAQIDDERRHRGIPRPRSGICSVCRSRRVTFQDDGWGRCSDCGNAFRWRGAFGLRQRLRGLLR